MLHKVKNNGSKVSDRFLLYALLPAFLASFQNSASITGRFDTCESVFPLACGPLNELHLVIQHTRGP